MLYKNDVIRLRHLLEAATDAVSFSQNKTRDSLDADKMLRFSIIRCVEIIGEAASKLSEDCRNQYPYLPGDKIVNMRNRLIHAYYDINLNILWNTVSKDLPPLIVDIEKIISDENKM